VKLPTWKRTEATQTQWEVFPDGTQGEEYSKTIVTHHCDDPGEMAFAWRCRVQDFALGEFDTWLATEPESDGKEGILATRKLAKDAATHWELRSHLQLLNAQRQHSPRVAELKPLAAEGKRIRETRALAAKTTNRKTEANKAERNARLASRARRLILANEATPRTVSGILVEQGQADCLQVKAVREILKKAGVR
jgi:hypothetical protein